MCLSVIGGVTCSITTIKVDGAQNFTLKDSNGNVAIMTKASGTTTGNLWLTGNATVTIESGIFANTNGSTKHCMDFPA